MSEAKALVSNMTTKLQREEAKWEKKKKSITDSFKQSLEKLLRRKQESVRLTTQATRSLETERVEEQAELDSVITELQKLNNDNSCSLDGEQEQPKNI